MGKSFHLFVEQLQRYPDFFQEKHLSTLLTLPEITTLKKLELLKRGSDLSEVTCQSCDDDHFLSVKVENEKPYCFCPMSDTARNYLDPEHVETWHFEAETFLQQMALQLGIDDRVEKLNVPHMWHIGGLTKDGMRHNCYYYQGKNIADALSFIQRQPIQMRRYVLFTNKEVLFSITSQHEFIAIPVNEMVDLGQGQVVFNKKIFSDYLVNGFRNVIFQKNGDLIANGETIANITPSTAEYHFVEVMWENFNDPVSHQRTQRHIYEKTGKEYEDDASKLAHKQKNKVKKESKNPKLIDAIFKRTKDFDGNNAYIMKNPA